MRSMDKNCFGNEIRENDVFERIEILCIQKTLNKFCLNPERIYQPIQNIYFRLCRNHTFSIASKLCKSIIQYTY